MRAGPSVLLQYRDSETGVAVSPAIIKHDTADLAVEHEGIADHRSLPAVRIALDPGPVVMARPALAIHRGGKADAIAPIVPAIGIPGLPAAVGLAQRTET